MDQPTNWLREYTGSDLPLGGTSLWSAGEGSGFPYSGVVSFFTVTALHLSAVKPDEYAGTSTSHLSIVYSSRCRHFVHHASNSIF